jgi:hypothetical protein
MDSCRLRGSGIRLRADTGTGAAVWAVLALLTVYNALSIVAVRRSVMPRLLVPAMLGLDLVFVLLAARLTGGAQSPFLGQSYLIILAAALLYDLRGGIAIGLAASVLALAAEYPAFPLGDLQVRVLGNLVPLTSWRADSPGFWCAA